MRGLAVGLVVGCSGASPAPSPEPPPTEQRVWSEDELALLASLRLSDTLPPDPTNRWSDDPGAVALGRALFHDAGLSPSGRFSCAHCHDPALHYTDGLGLAEAAGTAARGTPTIEGVQQGPWYFWDGRADSLWAQAAGPIESAVEMDSDRVWIVRQLVARYREPYEALFGPLPDLSDAARFPERARPERDGPLGEAWRAMAPEDQEAVTRAFVGALKAIAAFERTVLPGEAPFDRYVDALLAGDSSGGGHLDASAERGLHLFVGRGGCTSCHHGPYFTDRAFHALGLPEPGGYDAGRTVGALRVAEDPLNCRGPHSDAATCEELRFLNAAFEDFRGAFKTPPLRNVTRTAPYMHKGQFEDLRAVLTFYSTLPEAPTVGHRELTLQPLGLSDADMDDLMAFLGALQAPVRPEGLPLDALAP